MRIGIVDYGAGNVMSVLNMLNHLGYSSELVSEGSKLKDYDKIILPGVGKFDFAIQNLKNKNFIEELKIFKNRGKHILGICLGSQLLLDRSEEGVKDGLGLIPGQVRKFNELNNLPLPHMGWNSILKCSNHKILNEINNDQRFYFAHNYYLEVQNEYKIALSSYGSTFSSIVGDEQVIGVQFHPEKSLKFGMKLIDNFCKL